MTNRIIQPPTFAELLKDPVYRAYVLRAPRLPITGPESLPFRVWGIRHDDKWAGKLFSSYAEAFALVKRMLKQPDVYRDVVITTRPTGFGPPQGLSVGADLEWCGHCRRPTVYRRMRSHTAMKKWPVVDPDPTIRRCFYCACRRTAGTSYR